jgi:predicted ABC-type exoprotein transport system permease subunit
MMILLVVALAFVVMLGFEKIAKQFVRIAVGVAVFLLVLPCLMVAIRHLVEPAMSSLIAIAVVLLLVIVGNAWMSYRRRRANLEAWATGKPVASLKERVNTDAP